VISIFLPVAFMKGLIGKYFYQFGVVISATVVISLIEALTITPMRAAFFKGSVKHENTDGLLSRSERFFKVLADAYAATLQTSLRFKWLVIFFCVVFSVWSFSLFPKLKQEFIPPEDQSRFMVRMQTPVGSSIDYSDEKLHEVEEILAKDQDVLAFVAVAGANHQGGDFNNGMVFVTLKSPKDRHRDAGSGRARTQAEMMGELRKQLTQIKDVKVSLQDLSMRGLTTSRGMPIEFTVQGPDWAQLAEHTKTIIKEMKATGQIIDIDSDYKDGMPEIQIKPDREKISSRGVTMASVASVISSMLGGQIVNQYSTGGNRYDIRLRMDGVEDVNRANVFEVISRLKVRNQANTLIPLAELVNVEERTTSQSISRLSRERAITVYANVTPGTSQKVALTKIQEMAKNILPGGYKVKISGSSATFKESFDSLIFALLLGIAVAYMILATQFNSFIDPVSVLVALPLSVTGAFLALKWSGQSINIYSMIGLILLMGIAKKNSILLVEFTNHVQEFEKLNVREAIMKACPIRLRPILMTSLATVAGAIPPALALGPGAESRIPMAVAIIGGVLISTVFTLYFVPCVYLVLAPMKRSVSLMAEAEQTQG
jgi:HAE1 family hydrophobic/amphiphilic exporter-1